MRHYFSEERKAVFLVLCYLVACIACVDEVPPDGNNNDKPETLPAVPSDFEATANSANLIALAWKDNAGNEDGFELERSLSGSDFELIATLAADTTFYLDSELDPATEYFYRLRAFNANGFTSYTDVDSATTWFDSTDSEHTSIASGAWTAGSSWDTGQVPGDGDRVVIQHSIHIPAGTAVVIGHSPASGDANAAVLISPTGQLTLEAGSVLACRGDLKTQGNIILEQGAIFEIDSSEAASPANSVYLIEIKPGDSYAHLQVNGSAENRCIVRANPAGAHVMITDGGETGGGRIVAKFCNFSFLGGAPDYRAWSYSPTSEGQPFQLVDCKFEQCSQVKASGLVPAEGRVEFIRCQWSNSVIKPYAERDLYEEWHIHETGAYQGAEVKLIQCDFDRIVGLFSYHDYVIEDCVFREGLKGYSGAYWSGAWKSFRRNFVRWNSDEGTAWSLPGGLTLQDSIFIIDPGDCQGLDPLNCGGDNPDCICWNPHFIVMAGDGGANVIGCIWWWTGTDSRGEGDGVFIAGASDGTREDNIYRVERNIYLPNGNGPLASHNLSTTPFTILQSTNNSQVVFKRNTVFAGAWTGGCNIGETGVTYAHDIGYFMSNLFIGSTTNQGFKIHNLGNAQVDSILAHKADYNAGFRLETGSNFGNGSGKGYEQLSFSGSSTIGVHDKDDLDPQFVDAARTPLTWDTSLGGIGNLEASMDRLASDSGNTIQELLDYIREGFRPQNPQLNAAGDPNDPDGASPDIGAVDF